MKATNWFAACVAVALSVSPAEAQPVLQDYLDNADGHFLHRSAVLGFADPAHGLTWQSAHYAVCNFDPKNGLIFAWDKPGFSTGWRHPLSVGSCLTMSLDGAGFAPDNDAPILFTQNNMIKKASAYLPTGKEMPRSRSEVEALYDRNGAATLVSFTIVLAREPDGRVHGFVRWSQGTPSVAIAFDLPDDLLKGIMDSLGTQGVKVQQVKLKELIEERDPGRVDDAAREGPALSLSSPDRRAFSGEFYYKPVRNDQVSMPVILLDDERKMIARTSYQSIR